MSMSSRLDHNQELRKCAFSMAIPSGKWDIAGLRTTESRSISISAVITKRGSLFPGPRPDNPAGGFAALG